MRSVFGWDYPPGAEHDRNAPWNQTDEIQAGDYVEVYDKILEVNVTIRAISNQYEFQKKEAFAYSDGVAVWDDKIDGWVI